MYQGQYVIINNFKGGYCGNYPPHSLQLNQFFDGDNIVIKPEGLGFRSRLGNDNINTSAFNSGAAWQGLGDFTQSNGNFWSVGVAGSKFGTNASYGTSYTDSTGAVTITSGQDNQWMFLTFDDILIAFGGLSTAPDAPFKWTGSGNAAALGGSPPSAYGAFTTQNRVFAYRTSAQPSTIYWTILGNAEDWTSSGSGSAVVGSLEDNQQITGAQVLGSNIALIFKDTSTYQILLTSAPFPVYTLFDKVGCVGKFASVNVDGRVYWINQYGHMVSTNGEDLQEYPTAIDNVWSGVPTARYPFIIGQRQKGTDYDWLVWVVRHTAGTTNNRAIIWDLENECWLQCTTGYTFAVTAQNSKGKPYFGGYDGFVYEVDKSGQFQDDSSGVAIDAYMNYGYRSLEVPDKFTQVNKMDFHFLTKSSGSFTVSYNYDFNTYSKSFTVDMTDTSVIGYFTKSGKPLGRGNSFGFQTRLVSSTVGMEIYSIYLRGKAYGQKDMTTRT